MGEKLAGKIAVVTGASAGIGLGIARGFADEGARVFITGRDRSRLDDALAELGPGATGVQADAAKLTDIDRIYREVMATAGRIDILTMNAGIYELGTLGEISEAHFDNMFNTNVRGVLFGVQKALPLLSEGASVILIGSIASIKGFEDFGVYCATKAAVRSFARSWMLDLKHRGIRVNVLSPGHIDTPGLAGLFDETQKSEAVTRVPAGRLGTAEDVAKGAVFLASDDSNYINGVELFVDGGVAQY